jgi:hypothetical protein
MVIHTGDLSDASNCATYRVCELSDHSARAITGACNGRYRARAGFQVPVPLYTDANPRFLARSQNCEKRLLASSCLSVCMEQHGSHWTDFHEI